MKECYKALGGRTILILMDIGSAVWHKLIPSKVSCLVWRILQNTLPTKDNLVGRGILGRENIQCADGCSVEESVAHLFFQCPCFASIWDHVIRWFRLLSASPKDCIDHLNQFEDLIGSKKN